jgi:hypothetical protein
MAGCLTIFRKCSSLETLSTSVISLIFYFSKNLMATYYPVSLCFACFTFPKVPLPMVLLCLLHRLPNDVSVELGRVVRWFHFNFIFELYRFIINNRREANKIWAFTLLKSRIKYHFRNIKMGTLNRYTKFYIFKVSHISIHLDRINVEPLPFRCEFLEIWISKRRPSILQVWKSINNQS